MPFNRSRIVFLVCGEHVDGLSINRHTRPCLVVITGVYRNSAELP